jgi:Tol biopolymer transport system component
MIPRSVLLAALYCSPVFAQLPTATPPRPAVTGTFLMNGSEILDRTVVEDLDGIMNPRRSPDGKWLACVEVTGEFRRYQLAVRPARGIGRPLLFESRSDGTLFVWTRDSKRVLVVEDFAKSSDGKTPAKRTFKLCEPATGEVSELPLQADRWVTDWSLDGKRLLSSERGGLAWVSPDGKGEPEFITPADEKAYWGRLSPDGKRVLYQRQHFGKDDRMESREVRVMDLTTKRCVTVSEPGEASAYCWSPDGTRIAYTWQIIPKSWADMATRVAHLMVCDADGQNRRSIATKEHTTGPNDSGRNSLVIFFRVVDWR